MCRQSEEWFDKKNAKMVELEASEYPTREAYEAGADALEEMLKVNGQKVEKGDTLKFCRNYPGVGMKQYYTFTFEAPNTVCSIPEKDGE